jgi:tetratricopeptide (TPR) repeat protein
MLSIRLHALPCALILLCDPLAAAQHWMRPRFVSEPKTQTWISIKTSHFEMYTTNGEKQAIAALQRFEQVRYFFLQRSTRKTAPDVRVRIIAFSSEQEYKPFRRNAGTFAYYQRSRERDYIVMQDIQSDHYDAAVHEYTHLIAEHAKLNLPVWLNEGIAELYSSLESRGDRAMVGRPIPGSLFVLARQPWIDWNVLFGVDHNSPYYNDRERMQVFYAQSWALTHMLSLGAPYAPQFSKFVTAISGGMTTFDALEKIYGKSIGDIDKALHAYVRQATVSAALFDIKLGKSELEPQIAELSDLQVRLALADLFASREAGASEAQARLSELEKEHPGNPDIQASLAYLYWREKRLDDARMHFALAIKAGSKDPQLFHDYAELARSSGASWPEVMGLLQQALALNPDYNEARLLLGLLATEEKQFGLAYATLTQMRTIMPDDAYSYFTALAYCSVNLNKPQRAREAAQRALDFVKTPEQRSQVENLLHYIDEQQNMPALPAQTQ